jgi:tripartite-type tricarboxylate transporter receptor subunit TctC
MTKGNMRFAASNGTRGARPLVAPPSLGKPPRASAQPGDFLFRFFILLASIAIAASAAAQPWPQKPVRVLLPFPPGGASDILGRIVARKLAEGWGKPVVFENRIGAAGNLAAAEAAQADPDGYTLFFTAGSVITVNEHIYKRAAFNAERDFVAITNVASSPQVVVVPVSSPYKTLKELIDAAKAQPGKLKFGSGGIGSYTHLGAENLAFAAGIKLEHVPFNGEAPALNDLVAAAQLNFMMAHLAAATGFIKQQRVRTLAVTSRGRAPQLPDVPTVAETLPGFEHVAWFGFVAPRGTPNEIVDKIYQDTVKVLQTSEIKARLHAEGMVPLGEKPEEFARHIRAERARWAKIVDEQKIPMQ